MFAFDPWHYFRPYLIRAAIVVACSALAFGAYCYFA